MQVNIFQRSIFPVVVLLLITISMVLACSATDLHIVSQELTARQFTSNANVTQSTAIVSGLVRNSSNSTISECRITAEYFDDQNNKIGTAGTYRESLGPGEVWNFTVQLTNSDAWKARSCRINCSNK